MFIENQFLVKFHTLKSTFGKKGKKFSLRGVSNSNPKEVKDPYKAGGVQEISNRVDNRSSCPRFNIISLIYIFERRKKHLGMVILWANLSKIKSFKVISRMIPRFFNKLKNYHRRRDHCTQKICHSLQSRWKIAIMKNLRQVVDFWPQIKSN